MNTLTRSPLREMAENTPTRLWLDSIALDELKYALDNGAVGATCNPTIILKVLEQEMPLWEDRIYELIRGMPEATEDEIGWELVKLVSAERSKLLLPAFETYNGKNGRLSIQTDPRLYRDTARMAAQAIEFSQIAPNIVVKIPVTQAGVGAIEEAIYQGVSINATVSFTLSQAVAVAEAVERGLRRREREGKDVSTMGPVCTLMVGRLDDYFKEVVSALGLAVNPACLEWAGVTVFKEAYRLYRTRGYRTRLLAAAYRNHFHWSELIGGDVVVSPPFSWMRVFNNSDIEVVSRIEKPVDPALYSELMDRVPGFSRACSEDGLDIGEFDSFGPSKKALTQFSKGCNTLAEMVRGFMMK